MNNQKTKSKKKCPGPKPELISLQPFTFDEVLDTVLSSKAKKARTGRDKETSDEQNADNKD
jgi:hypothetical protein